MGLPDLEVLSYWLNDEFSAKIPGEFPVKTSDLKNPEIPILSDYSEGADEWFWEKFPKRELPDRATTKINIEKLKLRVEKAKPSMSASELKRAYKVISDLTFGADACQKSALPSMNTQNSWSAVDNGALLTDTIATWVIKEFVAGPFDTPPVAGFRANPLAVVVRNGKIQPILNMSGPKGKSFNNNVDKRKMEKLHMGTARQF